MVSLRLLPEEFNEAQKHKKCGMKLHKKHKFIVRLQDDFAQTGYFKIQSNYTLSHLLYTLDFSVKYLKCNGTF